MLTVRSAEINDIPSIIELALPTWRATYSGFVEKHQLDYILETTYSPTALRQQFDEGDTRTLLCEQSKNLLGFSAYRRKKEEAANIFRIERLYVLPQAHGKGVGTRLIQAVSETVKPLGAEVLELNVHQKNPAVGFYKKAGFAIAREEEKHFGPYKFPDFIMQKRIA